MNTSFFSLNEDEFNKKDKLFLLSKDEYEKYVKNTSYSTCSYNNEICRWWLRSPGESSKRCILSVEGNVCRDEFVDQFHVGVRPALYLKPAAIGGLPGNEKCIQFGNNTWIILDPKTGLLLSKDALFLYRFDADTRIYENSDIRNYLKRELMYTLFTPEEIELIADTEISREIPLTEGEIVETLIKATMVLYKLFTPEEISQLAETRLDDQNREKIRNLSKRYIKELNDIQK